VVRELSANLQVAIDVVNLDKAMRIAKATYVSGARYIEAGTPLIKKYGVLPVKIFRAYFDDAFIVADTKTMDAGVLEARVFYEAGADIVTVLALASKETIEEVTELAREYGKLVMVDFINVANPIERLEEIANIGFDIVCLHIGVDVQKRRGISIISLVNEARSIREKYGSIKLALAGGIKPQIIPQIIHAKPDIVIVGGYITKSNDPGKRAREILHAIASSGKT